MFLTLILVLVASIAAGVVPTIAYVLLVWLADRYEKEPAKLLMAAFLWGAIPAAIVSVIAEAALDVPLSSLSAASRAMVSTSVVAPLVEEGAKGLALLVVFWLARREFDDVLDGIIYGSIIGFGFAMTENVFYFVGAWGERGIQGWGMTVFLRSLAFGLNHAMYTSFTGVGFGLARYQRSWLGRWLFIALGLAAGIIAHLLHNALVSAGALCFLGFLIDWSGVFVLLLLVLVSWQRERKWIATELEAEVPTGVLTPLQYETIASRRERVKHGWRLLGIADLRQVRLWRRLIDAATELALKKHQHTTMGEERDNSVTIARLRARLLSLRQELRDPAAEGKTPCARCGRPLVAPAGVCPHCGATQ